MKKFVRAVFPMLIVLRLADQKDPVMDKLFFYVRRMDKTIDRSKEILDDLELQARGASWRAMMDITEVDATIDSDSDTVQPPLESKSDSNATDSDEEIRNTKSLGQKVKDIWQKRRGKLVSDYAIAGWLLSPIPEIYEDSKTNITQSHKCAVDRLLKKCMQPILLTTRTSWL